MHLYEQHCYNENKPQLLNDKQIKQYLKQIPEWDLLIDHSENKDINSISRTFKFKDYQQTLLFINTIAALIHKENHHPDIKFGYNHCLINYSTHSAGGVTVFDFICAAHIDKVAAQPGFNE